MRQIALMGEIGRALERFTRNAFLRHSLRMMRAEFQAKSELLHHGPDRRRASLVRQDGSAQGYADLP
jgi:hypothetical protein